MSICSSEKETQVKKFPKKQALAGASTKVKDKQLLQAGTKWSGVQYCATSLRPHFEYCKPEYPQCLPSNLLS